PPTTDKTLHSATSSFKSSLQVESNDFSLRTLKMRINSPPETIAGNQQKLISNGTSPKQQLPPPQYKLAIDKDNGAQEVHLPSVKPFSEPEQPKAEAFDPIDPESNSAVLFVSKQKTMAANAEPMFPRSILHLSASNSRSMDSLLTDQEDDEDGIEEDVDGNSGEEETEVVFAKGPIAKAKGVTFS